MSAAPPVQRRKEETNELFENGELSETNSPSVHTSASPPLSEIVRAAVRDTTESTFEFEFEPTLAKYTVVDTSRGDGIDQVNGPFEDLMKAMPLHLLEPPTATSNNKRNHVGKSINKSRNTRRKNGEAERVFLNHVSASMVYSRSAFLRCLVPGRMELAHNIRISARGQRGSLLARWERDLCFYPCQESDCIAQQLFELPVPSPVILPPWLLETNDDTDVDADATATEMEEKATRFWTRLEQMMEIYGKPSGNTATAAEEEEEDYAKNFVVGNPRDGKQHRSLRMTLRNHPEMCVLCLMYKLVELNGEQAYLSVCFPWFEFKSM